MHCSSLLKEGSARAFATSFEKSVTEFQPPHGIVAGCARVSPDGAWLEELQRDVNLFFSFYFSTAVGGLGGRERGRRVYSGRVAGPPLLPGVGAVGSAAAQAFFDRRHFGGACGRLTCLSQSLPSGTGESVTAGAPQACRVRGDKDCPTARLRPASPASPAARHGRTRRVKARHRSVSIDSGRPPRHTESE